MRRRRLAKLLWLALLCWACSVLLLSLLRPDKLPEAAFLFWDKVNHFAAFTAGGWLAAQALLVSRAGAGRTRLIVAAIVMIAAFGALDEALQTLFPGRSGADIYDWTADVLGAITGALLAGLRPLTYRPHPRSPMNLAAIALTGAALIAGPVAQAGPAGAAEPDMTGTYTFAAEDGQSATWTITPCAEGADMCVLVAETGNSRRVPWTGDAHYTVGSWILFIQQPDAILCPDGTSAPGMNTYSWDAVALTGSASINSKGACGAKPGSLSIPFTLSRIGPPPAVPAPADPPPAPPAAPPPAAATGDAAPPAAPPAATPPADLPESAEAPLSAESPVGPPPPPAN